MTSHRERGNATLEAVMLAPALVAILALAIAAGRVGLAHSAVEAAARDAARQASIARDPAQAQAAATASATDTLVQQGLDCSPTVQVDASGLSRAIGTNATVNADVTCDVALSGLLLPGMPGTVTVTATFASPVDPFRGTP
ncbi:pilus assembly protein [Nonomuraea sp. NBC_00507]|uniref:TadE/TadG family type IV pilus assembly protein n=1 Tax=Nonomuraea sp. NBC_00507 TaxID=2976002 RepID=UPI002E16E3D8